MSTKIHATVDALGNPTGFHLTGGQEHDLAGADALLPDLEAETLIADKAFDADQRVLEPLAEAGKAAVIPSRKTRTIPRAFDKDPLQGPASDRELLRQAQAVPRHCHPLRQDRAMLPGWHSPGRRSHLAQLRTGPSPKPSIALESRTQGTLDLVSAETIQRLRIEGAEGEPLLQCRSPQTMTTDKLSSFDDSWGRANRARR